MKNQTNKKTRKNIYIFKNIKKKPLYSVITVVKNDERNISKTIKSVLNQSYKNFEYIIVDGKSTDDTLKILSKYKNKISRIITKPDKGIYFAMNKGIKVSKGKIIVFINSGDLFSKNALKIVNNIFEKNKNLNFVFGTVRRHYTKSTILKHGFDKNKLKYNFDFATAHSTGFFLKKKIFDKYGVFNTKYNCSADYDLYYRLILKNKLIGSYSEKNQLVGIVKSGGYSSKINFFDHIVEETKIRINNDQNLIIVIIIFFNAVIKGILKKLI